MDLDQIEQIIGLMSKSSVSELILEKGDKKLLLRKPSPVIAVSASPETAVSATEAISTESSPETPSAPEVEIKQITAPVVGIFHRTEGNMDSGCHVTVGQIVGNIEVMKLGNEVRSDWEGTIQKRLVEEGQPVEYGQTLFEIVPGELNSDSEK